MRPRRPSAARLLAAPPRYGWPDRGHARTETASPPPTTPRRAVSKAPRAAARGLWRWPKEFSEQGGSRDRAAHSGVVGQRGAARSWDGRAVGPVRRWWLWPNPCSVAGGWGLSRPVPFR